MPVGRSRANPWLTALLLLLIAVVALAGCARNRTSPSQAWSGVAVEAEAVYVGTKDGRVVQLSSDTGAPRVSPFKVPEADAESGEPAFYGTPIISGDRLYVAGYNGFIYSMNAADLTDVSVFEVDSDGLAKGVAGSLAAAGSKVVVAVSEDVNQGRLYVLNADTLAESCRYPARGLDPVGQIWSTPVIADGVAYFGGLDHRLHAVTVEGCTQVWAPRELGGAIVAPPVVIGDKLYVGTFDRSFYEIDIETGLEIELFSGEGWFWGAPATDGEVLYVPNMDGRIYAYEPAARRLLWAEPNDNLEPVLSTPVIVGEYLVYGSDAGNLNVLRRVDGGFEWGRSFSDKIRAPLTVDGNIVLVHDLSNTVTAIDIGTKRVVWDRDLDDVN
ncbi:MAG: PQQ-binding-like beta-propeller repeat protein [Dehalococcoidia bacterium]